MTMSQQQQQQQQPSAAADEQPFDFGTLSHSTLPDLSLINQPKLTLDLGTTDLSVSLDELKKNSSSANPTTPNQQTTHDLNQHQQEQSTTTNHCSTELDRNRSRRWTSLSELGRAVMKPSISNLRQLGSLNERGSVQQQRAIAAHNLPARRLSEASGTPSIYSSYRVNRNLFKLFSHEPTIQSSPTVSPGSSPGGFPSLPPMSELLDVSTSFNQQDLSSITEPILFARQTDQLPVHSKPISSILSAQPPTLKPLPASPPQSPSPSSSQSSSEEPEEEIPEVEAEEQETFASAVQSPAVVEVNDLPSPQTVLTETKQISSSTSLKSSPESSPIVPTIDRVLSRSAEDEAVQPAEEPSVPPTKKDAPETPSLKSPSAPIVDSKNHSHHPTSASNTITHHNSNSHSSKTHLAGILNRKKKSSPSAGAGTSTNPGTGSGTTSFFKLFLFKGLGLKHLSHPLGTNTPKTSTTASSPARPSSSSANPVPS
ncbi:hypothetical protein PGT21_006010 [Puccinia graminis f. sp. tritici]|uniref:Uncharacterized protein n=1 Tax=Puccinia graminis f. sp. tritici TaxID=56615 RepID=A0A5B0QZZ6_PUCGR|nr:hypothetical protein PGT21_006010 [Puccinia graminis f. sp. tritici]